MFTSENWGFMIHFGCSHIFSNGLKLETTNDTPWKNNMEPIITHLERNIIFQASMIMFHVNLPGCSTEIHTFVGGQSIGENFGCLANPEGEASDGPG